MLNNSNFVLPPPPWNSGKRPEKTRDKQQDIQEASGHTLEYLPPYSPDLNPIEKK